MDVPFFLLPFWNRNGPGTQPPKDQRLKYIGQDSLRFFFLLVLLWFLSISRTARKLGNGLALFMLASLHHYHFIIFHSFRLRLALKHVAITLYLQWWNGWRCLPAFDISIHRYLFLPYPLIHFLLSFCLLLFFSLIPLIYSVTHPNIPLFNYTVEETRTGGDSRIRSTGHVCFYRTQRTTEPWLVVDGFVLVYIYSCLYLLTLLSILPSLLLFLFFLTFSYIFLSFLKCLYGETFE